MTWSERVVQMWKLIAAQISRVNECLQLAGSVVEATCLDLVWGGEGLPDQDTGE